MEKHKVRGKLKKVGLVFTPVFLFLTLLFSELIALFGWSKNDGIELISDTEEPARKQFDYINIQIDSTLSYEPSLIKAGLIYDYTENKLVWEKNL